MNLNRPAAKLSVAVSLWLQRPPSSGGLALAVKLFAARLLTTARRPDSASLDKRLLPGQRPRAAPRMSGCQVRLGKLARAVLRRLF
jgi:hypothetical protein